MSETTESPDLALKNDTPAVIEGEQQAVQDDEPETLTLTKAQLQDEKNAAAAKARAQAERKGRRELEALEAKYAPKVRQETPLVRENYANEDEFIEAKVEQRLVREAQTAQIQQEASRAKSLVSEASKVDGFDPEIFETLPITETMKDALLDSDTGSALLAYLTQNPDEADRIADLSPIRQVRELAKLETELNAKPAKKQTAAPPVGTKIGGGGNTLNAYKTNPDTLDDAAWARERKKEIVSRLSSR